jgi:hypothetical protein
LAVRTIPFTRKKVYSFLKRYICLEAIFYVINFLPANLFDLVNENPPFMLLFIRTFLLSFLMLWADLSFAVAYYVSSNGNDAHSGASPGTAWRTILRVNQAQLLPGDQVLFEAGSIFEGSLYLDAASGGLASNPVVIGSYGSGRATIFTTGTAFFVYNTGGVTIKDLIFQGTGIGVSTQDGIVFYNTLTQNTKLAGITLLNLRVSGFGRSGILLYGEGADNSKSGYRDVRIEQVEVFNNADNGLIVGGNYQQNTPGYHHENVVIRLVKAYQNPGIANKGGHSGSGILLGNTQNGLIEYCHAWGNGANNNFSGGGPVGIWTWDANFITIQYNEANHNRTRSMDGGGFDLDGGVTNSVIQYNYSHNNDGPGYLVAQFSNANVMENNIIRYNISQNDGRRRPVGGVHFWAASNAKPVRNILVYGNTVIVNKNYNSNIAAIRVGAGNFTGIDFINNILMTRNKAFVVHIASGTTTSFLGNAYFDFGNGYAYWYHGSTFSSLNNWRSSRGVERWNNNAVGFQGNPQLNSPGNGKTIGDPVNMHNLIPEYQLQISSPMIDNGLPVATITGKPDGGIDFYRNQLPLNGKRAIGAHQLPFQTTTTNFALTVAVNGQGSVSRSPNQTSYSAGTTVSLTPQAASGWQFSHWQGASTGSAVPLSLLMDSQKSVTAVFYRSRRGGKARLARRNRY